MATATSVAVRPDARGTTTECRTHVLQLVDGRYVAVCTCRWTGETYHRKHDRAVEEAADHEIESRELAKLEERQERMTFTFGQIVGAEDGYVNPWGVATLGAMLVAVAAMIVTIAAVLDRCGVTL